MARRAPIAGFVLAVTFGGAAVASAVPIGVSRLPAVARSVHQVRVADRAEAWYATPSGAVCLPLIGCLPVPLPLPSLYPTGTLHVGVTAGAESARSYVVPAARGKAAEGGLLELPVDSSSIAGTTDLSAARIKACLTTGRLTAGGAATGTAPGVNCKVSAPAKYDAAHRRFVVNLQPFLVRWRRGAPERGVALLPVSVGGLGTWQVAFVGKGGPAPRIYSLLSYAARRTPHPRPSVSSGKPEHETAPPPVSVPLPGAIAISPTSSPPAIAPPARSAVYLVRSKGFRYPAIFVAPLAILAGVIFFGRLFTGSTVRPRARLTMGADSSDG